MSNENPTFEELKEVVDKINNLYENQQYNDQGIIPPFTLCTVECIHGDLFIRLLGQLVWSSSDDYRPNIDEDHQEYELGVDKKVSLGDYVLSELMGVNVGLNRMLDELTLGSNNQEEGVWKTITTYH
tara:strand:+ start:94 stop:474 length:381 start_codon:yes stop_codon:yes gene_type:complete